MRYISQEIFEVSGDMVLKVNVVGLLVMRNVDICNILSLIYFPANRRKHNSFTRINCKKRIFSI